MLEALRKEKTDFVFDGTGSPAQVESLRHIRTNIVHILPEKENGAANVVLFVSTTAFEGRSAIAKHLSDIFAHSGLNVLFIDCNIRTAKGGNKGVSEYLNGQAGLDGILKKCGTFGYDVIPAGAPSEKANELLSSSKFGEMLGSLSGSYDYIFIDAPPLGDNPDGFAVAMPSDGVIAVTRRKLSTQTKLSEMLAGLEFIGANILGFIMTDCKR